MQKIAYYLSLTILLLSCGEQNAHSTATAQEVKKEADDALIMRLSMEINPKPSTQAEQDQNAILNYAIDNNLDVQRTHKGLYYLVEKAGEGELLKWGDRISVEYTGQFLDGKVFDSTSKRGEALTFYIGNMIAGWNEGLQLLRPGGKAIFLVPSDLAYGKTGLGKIVPPNSVLRFDLEVTEKL